MNNNNLKENTAFVCDEINYKRATKIRDRWEEMDKKYKREKWIE